MTELYTYHSTRDYNNKDENEYTNCMCLNNKYKLNMDIKHKASEIKFKTFKQKLKTFK